MKDPIKTSALMRQNAKHSDVLVPLRFCGAKACLNDFIPLNHVLLENYKNKKYLPKDYLIRFPCIDTASHQMHALDAVQLKSRKIFRKLFA